MQTQLLYFYLLFAQGFQEDFMLFLIRPHSECSLVSRQMFSEKFYAWGPQIRRRYFGQALCGADEIGIRSDLTTDHLSCVSKVQQTFFSTSCLESPDIAKLEKTTGVPRPLLAKPVF